MSSSAEVDNATGEAPAKVDVVQLLDDKRRALNGARERYKIAKSARDEQEMANESRLIDALRELISILETDAAVVLEATGRKEAEHRLLGIRRAYGSVLTEYKEDDTRVQQVIAELGEAITALNSRARKLEALRVEAAALADRFELTVPILTIVPEPQYDIASSLPPFWRLQGNRPSFEACEHNLRHRRDYTEIGGTSGYAIIQTAGLKPFRALTAPEAEVLEDKAEWKPDPVLAAAAVEATALGKLGAPGGHIQRG